MTAAHSAKQLYHTGKNFGILFSIKNRHFTYIAFPMRNTIRRREVSFDMQNQNQNQNKSQQNTQNKTQQNTQNKKNNQAQDKNNQSQCR